MNVKVLAPFGKAIYEGAVAGLGALAAVLVDGSDFGDVTAGQWVTIVLATLVAFGGVLGLDKRQTQAGDGGA